MSEILLNQQRKGQIVKYVIMGLALECFGCLVFILISSRTSLGRVGKPVIVTTTVIGILLLLVFAARNQKLKSLLLLSLLLAFGYSLFETIIGFLWFPGIVKDIEFLSLSHLIGFAIWTTVLFVIHAFVSVVCRSLWILFTKIPCKVDMEI